MNLRIVNVTKYNQKQAKKISVFNYQKGYIESVDECLHDARERSDWVPVCIELDGEIIAFAMYGYINEEKRLWIDRFIIDKHFQGHGYARPVIDFIIKHLNDEYEGEDIYLSVYEDNEIAIKLYREFGFEFNGELDLNGEKIMVLKNLYGE